MHLFRTALLLFSTSLLTRAVDLAYVEPGPPVLLDDYLVETNPATFDRKAPAVTQQVLAHELKNMNVPTTASALRNFPNLFIRERYIGDKNAPIGIRGTSNRQTGRTLVLADGILLSNFLGTGFGNSPRWFLLAPEEIEKVAVIYGPFSALYAGNSIGGTVLFTTSIPQGFSASLKAQYFFHEFDEYGTHDDLQGSNLYASFGDRRGRLSYFAFYNHLNNRSASTQFWTVNDSATAPASASASAGATPVTGAFRDLDFSGRARTVYGAEGPTEAVHDLFKLKLGYEVSPELQLRYTLAYWVNDEDRDAPQTYLRDAAGGPVWSGRVESAGRSFNISPSQFSLARREQADLINALTVAYQPETGFQAMLTGNLYDVLKDRQAVSTGALPLAREGGPGQATIAGSTGWEAADLKLGYRAADGWLAGHAPSFGYHFDHFFNRSNQYSLSDWRDRGSRTGLVNGAGGATRIHALYAQDIWSFAPQWSLTPGVRWERWNASEGYRERDGAAGRVRAEFADRTESAWSPKLAVAWRPSKIWSARLSFGEAYRFPTVGELFQGSLSPNGSVTNNDPDLRAERALDQDLTIERTLEGGSVRLSLFAERVTRALISQSVLREDGTSFTGTQNVGRISTRGAELSYERRKFLIETLSVSVAVSYTDAKIRENDPVLVNGTLFPTVGKQVPRIPYWQARGGLTWEPLKWFSLSAQVRTSSHQYNTLENSDPYGGYGGVDAYTVADAKAGFRLSKTLSAALGCDNLANEKYHVFHPMPERTWYVEVRWDGF
jgi:iron complex outermembrane receptor protein